MKWGDMVENIFGLIIFILFVIARAMADRSKGMAKKPGTTAKPPKLVTMPKPAGTQAAPPAKPRRAVPSPQPQVEKTAYGSIPYMEELRYELRSEPETEQTIFVQPEITSELQDYTLTNEDLKRAVIWSEILQKPRFRTRLRYSR